MIQTKCTSTAKIIFALNLIYIFIEGLRGGLLTRSPSEFKVIKFTMQEQHNSEYRAQ